MIFINTVHENFCPQKLLGMLQALCLEETTEF